MELANPAVLPSSSGRTPGTAVANAVVVVRRRKSVRAKDFIVANARVERSVPASPRDLLAIVEEAAGRAVIRKSGEPDDGVRPLLDAPRRRGPAHVGAHPPRI